MDSFAGRDDPVEGRVARGWGDESHKNLAFVQVLVF
jgi:hypothetical protein